MDIYTVSLFGHREMIWDTDLEKNLEDMIIYLLQTKEYVEFLIGRDGTFDLMASGIIHRIRNHLGNHNSDFTWVMPYPKKEYTQNPQDFENYYSNIEIFQPLCSVHPKRLFSLRNQYMIDRSDLVICYVRATKGGAAKAKQYAQKRAKLIWEL